MKKPAPKREPPESTYVQYTTAAPPAKGGATVEQPIIPVPWGYEDLQHLLDNSIKLGRVGRHWWYATETGDPKEPWAMWCDADIDRLAQGAWVPARSLTEIEREWYEIFWVPGHAEEICYTLEDPWF